MKTEQSSGLIVWFWESLSTARTLKFAFEGKTLQLKWFQLNKDLYKKTVEQILFVRCNEQKKPRNLKLTKTAIF